MDPTVLAHEKRLELLALLIYVFKTSASLTRDVSTDHAIWLGKVMGLTRDQLTDGHGALPSPGIIYRGVTAVAT